MDGETAKRPLLDRLRAPRNAAFHGMEDGLCLEAADEIEFLRNRIVLMKREAMLKELHDADMDAANEQC